MGDSLGDSNNGGYDKYCVAATSTSSKIIILAGLIVQ
jgi:hypothetical protein